MTAAARGAGLADPSPAYKLRAADPEFAARWVDAVEKSTETLEAEARRRALQGSDTMLIFLLKARRPEVYRDNYKVTVESRGADAREAAALRELVASDPEAREALVAAARVLALASQDEAPRLPAGDVIDGEAVEDGGGGPHHDQGDAGAGGA